MRGPGATCSRKTMRFNASPAAKTAAIYLSCYWGFPAGCLCCWSAARCASGLPTRNVALDADRRFQPGRPALRAEISLGANPRSYAIAFPDAGGLGAAARLGLLVIQLGTGGRAGAAGALPIPIASLQTDRAASPSLVAMFFRQPGCGDRRAAHRNAGAGQEYAHGQRGRRRLAIASACWPPGAGAIYTSQQFASWT